MLSTTIPTETNFTNNPLEYKISPINTPANFNHSKIESTRNMDNTPVDLSIDSQLSAPLLEHKASQPNANGRRKKRTLEDFEILSKNPDELGRGTYSQVQLVKEKRPPYRLYAMKMINKDDLRDQHMVDHLKREVKIHKKLNHPHIVRLCCYFEDNENAYLVLEHAQNGSLITYLKSKEKLKEAEAFIYCFHICLGLDYLHKKGIVHRDLKTENLLINEFGNVLLSDFGFSVEDSENRNTFCGTLDYIAPEMIQNLPHDKKVDIWALGIVLYELLHGSTPFKDLTFESTIETFKQDINFGHISEEAKSFIKSLLQINPSDRPDFITIFNHPWMQKYAKKHHIDINYYLSKNMDALSTSETSELALRKSISNPVILPSMSDSEISVEQVPVPTLYDSAMVSMDGLAYTGIEQANNMEEKVNGDSDLSQLVLNGPLIQSDKTDGEESSSMEGSEKIESENTSPLKKKDIWQEVNIIEPVNKSEQLFNKEERPKTPTSTSRGRNPAKKRYDKENVAGLNNSNESPVKESKSPVKSSFEDRKAKKQAVTESAPGTELNRLSSSTSLDHVQIYRFDPDILRMPDSTVSENRKQKGETIQDLKITDVGSSEGVMDPVVKDVTRDLAGNPTRKDLSVVEDLHSNRTKEMSPLSHFQNKVEVKEKVVYENISISNKGGLALEEAFPAPIVHNLSTLGLPAKKSKETSPIVYVQRDLGREEIKTETSSESSRSFINNSELDAYIKTHPLHSREEVKEMNHVFTTEVEALPVTLQDGPLIVQTQAILFETRPKLISGESGAQEKDHRSKHLEQKEVTNLLNSFMDKSEREQARNKKLEFASLEPFETVKTKLESHTGVVKAGPTSFRAKNVVPKTEIEVTVHSSREPVNKASQAPVEVYLDAPRGAKGHVEHPLAGKDNVIESPHFSFGGANKLVKEDLLWPELDNRDNQSSDVYQKSLENVMKKDESWRNLLTKSKSMPKASNVQTVKENAAIIMDNDVPYVFERIDVKGNNHEQVKRKKSGEDYEIERQLLLSKYKNKLNDLTNMSKQKEKQLEEDDDEEKVRESRPILKKGKTMDSAKNTARILTFENSEEFDSKEEKSKRKKIKGLDAQSFNRSVKDLRRKNEQIESLLDDLNSGDRYVSRPSGKNFSYIRDEVPREKTPEKPGLFSKFMAMFGCVERERPSQPVKDIRPSLKRFNK